MPKSQPLRPGEIKILKALLDKEKTNGDLQKETGLQSNILSEYLKRLQKVGLVERNPESRKYKAYPPTFQALYFNEVLEFIRTQFEKSMKSNNDEAGILSGPDAWIVMTEAPGQARFIEKRLMDPKNFDALTTVSGIVEDCWEEYCVSIVDKSNPKTVKNLRVIETYKKFLQDIAEQLYQTESPELKEAKSAEFFESVKKEMAAAYPGVDVPKEMIRIETARKLKKIADRSRVKPSNLNYIYTLAVANGLSLPLQKIWTEKERQEMTEKEKFLKNPKNKKIYEEHLKHLNEVPKSLIFYPSWGFRGYPEKMRALTSTIH